MYQLNIITMTSHDPSVFSHTSPRQLFSLAWPVLAAQLATMTMMVADTFILGRIHNDDLAAVAIGGGVYVSLALALASIVQALSPMIAHHVGAGRRDQLAPTLHQGFWMALLLALPGIVLLHQPQWLLAASPMSESVAHKTSAYLATAALGLPATLLHRAFYAFVSATGKPRILMWINLCAACIHAPLAWVLATGAFTGDPLGAAGCASSSAFLAWFNLAIGLLWLMRAPAWRDLHLLRHWHGPQRPILRELLHIGLPIGLSTFVEITSFTLIALFAASLGPTVLAGHRIIGNVSAVIYMLPLSLAIATQVRVGQAAGAQSHPGVLSAVRSGMGLATLLSTLLGALIWIFREPITAFFSKDPDVMAVATPLFAYVALYQLFDAVQTVAGQALRGLKVTASPMLIHMLCFWGVGMGGGWWLCFQGVSDWLPPQGIAGFWQGAVLSTIAASIAFASMLIIKIRER